MHTVHADGLAELVAPLTHPLPGNAELIGNDLSALLVFEGYQKRAEGLLSAVPDEVPRNAGRARGLHGLIRVLCDDLVETTRGTGDLRFAERTRLRLLTVTVIVIIVANEGEAVGSAVDGVKRLGHGVLQVCTTYTVVVESGPTIE
jgi:hypothetical protein